jgi:hypothetical protein
VPTRLIYDPKTKKKLKPKIRFKGWHLLVLCRHCGKVIEKKLTLSGLITRAELLFCPECAFEMIVKMFKRGVQQVKEVILEEELAEKN